MFESSNVRFYHPNLESNDSQLIISLDLLDEHLEKTCISHQQYGKCQQILTISEFQETNQLLKSKAIFPQRYLPTSNTEGLHPSNVTRGLWGHMEPQAGKSTHKTGLSRGKSWKITQIFRFMYTL